MQQQKLNLLKNRIRAQLDEEPGSYLEDAYLYFYGSFFTSRKLVDRALFEIKDEIEIRITEEGIILSKVSGKW